MLWLRLLEAMLGLARDLTRYVERKQLMDAGEARLIRQQLEASNNVLRSAKASRANAYLGFDTAGGLPDKNDPNLRD